MNVKVIQSGSDGNCTVVEYAVALDMGVPFYKISPFSKLLKVVFIGHEHGDHFKTTTIKNLAQMRPMLRFCCGEFLVPKLLFAGVRMRNIDIMHPGKVLDYGDFKIEPIELYHDVPTYGCKLYFGDKKLCYIVDTGSLEGIEAKGFDYYLVEANHMTADIEERANEKISVGEYAYEIRAAENHLSYEQTMDWLTEQMGTNSLWIPMHRHVTRGGGDNG